jgi:hypothetical protein
MNRIIQGVVHGRTIELDNDPGIDDGRTIDVVLLPKEQPGPPPGWTPGGAQTAAGTMADHWTDEDDRILEQIYQDRRRDSHRQAAE